MSYFKVYTPDEKYELINDILSPDNFDSIILNYFDGFFDRFVKIDRYNVSIDNEKKIPYEKIEKDDECNICFLCSVGDYGELSLKINLNSINQYWI